MKNFRESSNFELLKQRLETTKTILSGITDNGYGIENEIGTLKANIESQSAILKEIKNQIETTNQFIQEESYIGSDQLRLLEEVFPENENLDNLVITKETINIIYENLKTKENEITQELSANKSRLAFLENRKNNLEETVNQLEGTVASLENEYNNLTMELTSAKNNYSDIKSEYDSAQTELNSKNYNINIINEANLPESPVSPNTKLNVAIAAVLGLMLAVFIIFFREFMKEE